VHEDDEECTNSSETHINAFKPWLDEYQLYLTVREVVQEGMDAIQWWGASHKVFTRPMLIGI
jgi:hypothetical protein